MDKMCLYYYYYYVLLLASPFCSGLSFQRMRPFVHICSVQTGTKLLSLKRNSEDESFNNKRLRESQLVNLELGEKLRQEQVSEDKIPYSILFALQFLPLLGSTKELNLIYFLGVAITTVYLGGRQQTIDEPETISKKNALFAPIGASLSLFLLYRLIKLGIDPTLFYSIAVTLFGALAISDIGVPILRNIVPIANEEIKVPKKLAQFFGFDDSIPLDGSIMLLVGLICTAAYWVPVPMTQKFILSNIIAWAIAMISMSAISLGTFQTGFILLTGLFCYDIFWVFKTDVMMTVALNVEAPVKFLYALSPSAETDYPFSVLGLGDVVIPGLFIRFMVKMDQVLKPSFSYFTTATSAYALALFLCFVVSTITKSGQPALLYINPACIISVLLCGIKNGQVDKVLNFKE